LSSPRSSAFLEGSLSALSGTLDSFDQPRRREIAAQRNDFDFTAQRADKLSLRQRLHAVRTAFCEHVRAYHLQDFLRTFLAERHQEIDGLKSREHFHAIFQRIHGASRALEMTNPGIAVQRNDK